jgi:lipopolysaccharide/colanic/teichoic acid biosynthesis glycosyltransferase
MISDAPAKGGELTVMADPRITKCGKWLRRTKLDELPQFINVLIGAMSLVGPRPEVPRYVAKYPPEMRHIVLSVRPGITDMASIKFRNESALLSNSSDPEATYLEEILPIKLGYYVDYVHKRSIVLDVKILYWTVLAVFGEK